MITVSMLTPEICRNSPKILFVFGDNLIQKGKAGQACIRDEPNAFGIPTKRLPSMESNAFFSDDVSEMIEVLETIRHLAIYAETYEIVFPKAGLGTGLSKMEEKSPILFKLMNELLNKYFPEG